MISGSADATYRDRKFLGPRQQRRGVSDGVGLGVRGRKFGNFLDLSPLTIFGAYTWTESDEMAEDGSALINQGTTEEWRFGVGFNLPKALKWLKSPPAVSFALRAERCGVSIGGRFLRRRAA